MPVDCRLGLSKAELAERNRAAQEAAAAKEKVDAEARAKSSKPYGGPMPTPGVEALAMLTAICAPLLAEEVEGEPVAPIERPSAIGDYLD